VTDSRLGKIWELVAEQAASHGSGMSAGDACAAAVARVQVTGGWLTAGSSRAGPSDATAGPGHRRPQPLSRGPGGFDPEDVRVGQALADVAAIGLHERSMRRSDALNEQLQSALNSRVVIEQAKGRLAERLGLDMSGAFIVLRDHARSHNRRLSDVARAFVEGTEAITDPRPRPDRFEPTG
jgi:hypothetical protein